MGRAWIYVRWVMLAWLWTTAEAQGFNITTYLWKHPEFTTFNSLLTATNVAGEVNNRSSLTILALSNSQLEPFISSYGGNLPTQEVSDVLRYHVLLEYLDWDRLQQITAGGTVVTTLYQTTGRAPNNTGAVNVTTVDGQVRIGVPVPGAAYNATISGMVDKFPYVISIVRISSMILPYGFDLSGSPAPSPVGFNVTDVLVKARNFNFFVSLMEASGVVSEFQSEEAGAGITIFAPTDDAFSALNPEMLQGLTADKKAVILKYHVLLSYYPLGTLQTIVNPVQPTLATQAMGASEYTLNITTLNGVVVVNTGIVQPPVTETVFDQKPLAIFAVPKVLLPVEIFGAKNAPSPSPTPSLSPASAPAFIPGQSPAPAISPVFSQPPIFPHLPPVAQPPAVVVARPPVFPPIASPFLAPSSFPMSATPPAMTPSMVLSSPPTSSLAGDAPSPSPSPSPFSSVGKVTSAAAPADSFVIMAVLRFACFLAVNLVFGDV